MTKTIIAGHSHITSMGIPLKTENGSTALVEIRPNVFGFVGGWPRTRDYWQGLYDASESQSVFLSWMGNQHMAGFLFEPDQPIDFHCSTRPDLAVDETAQLVPQSLVEAHLQDSLEGLSVALKNMKSRDADVVLIGTPPPKGDKTKLTERLHKEAFFVRAAAEAGTKIGDVRISSPILLLKIWVTLQSLIESAAASFDVRFLPAPKESQDGVGFLKEEYWHTDVTHANALYGKLVLDMILATKGN